MKAINNIVQATKNILNVAGNSVEVASTLIADGTGVVNQSVSSTPAVLNALLTAPFAAAKGYIMESEGVSGPEAEQRAYRFIRQNLSVTITEAGVGSGKVLAAILAEEDLEAAVTRSAHPDDEEITIKALKQ